MTSPAEQCQERRARAAVRLSLARIAIGVLIRPESCGMVPGDINSTKFSRSVARGSARWSVFFGGFGPGGRGVSGRSPRVAGTTRGRRCSDVASAAPRYGAARC